MSLLDRLITWFKKTPENCEQCGAPNPAGERFCSVDHAKEYQEDIAW